MRFLALLLALSLGGLAQAKELEPVSLEQKYRGEELGQAQAAGFSGGAVPVMYLNEQEREAYKIQFVDGLAYDSRGELVDTYGYGNELNYSIFVMDMKGKFYVAHIYNESTEQEEKIEGMRFHHSSFMAGADVADAGKIRFKNGRLIKLNNDSGHYMPGGVQHEQAINELKKYVDYEFEELRVDPESNESICGGMFEP